MSVLASARLDDGPETYADRPYCRLGKVDLDVKIDISPATGHVLEALWGSKNDERTAIVTVNVEVATFEAGEELRLRVSEKR